MRIVYWHPWTGGGFHAWFQEDVFDANAVAQFWCIQGSECVWIVPGTLTDDEL